VTTMRRISAIAIGLVFFSTAALADSLRSDKHFVKIDVHPAGNSRQYDVQVFDAETRTGITQLKVVTKGDTPAESETTAGGTHYKVRIEPHGATYLIAFTADDGADGIDRLRGGFMTAAKSKPVPARVVRAGHEINVPAVLRRVAPVYTEEAKAAGAAGAVVVELLIDKSGFVREATVVQPMGHGLSESAVDAVKQWQFAPAMHEGVPVEVAYEAAIDFKP
jgi:TonB family protein